MITVSFDIRTRAKEQIFLSWYAPKNSRTFLPCSQVKLDVGDKKETSPWRDNRNGIFVVYNCARLSTIFTRFEEEVEKGKQEF